MNVSPLESAFQENKENRSAFSSLEWDHCRLVLRRLRFLETQMKEHGIDNTPVSQFAQREAAALEWLLNDAGFLKARE